MADNVNITAGAGTIIGARSRTVNGVANTEIQSVGEIGSVLVYTAQINVSTATAGVTLAAARSDRKRILITNRQSEPVYINGGLATVTTANGYQLDPGDRLELYTTSIISGITADASSNTGKVHVLEEADL